MSLYNALFGVNELAPVLLKILGIAHGDIPRFRDAYLDDGKIVIHTRTGGGNRECYESPNNDNEEGPWNETMYKNQHYLFDEDDEFDNTYANFYFKVPEEYEDDINHNHEYMILQLEKILLRGNKTEDHILHF